MSKGMTKRIALFVAIITAFSLVIAGCGEKPAPSASPSAPAASGAPSITTSYKIGVNTWGAGVPVLDKFADNGEYVVKLLGGTTMRASDDFTPDKESQNVQTCSAMRQRTCDPPA